MDYHLVPKGQLPVSMAPFGAMLAVAADGSHAYHATLVVRTDAKPEPGDMSYGLAVAFGEELVQEGDVG